MKKLGIGIVSLATLMAFAAPAFAQDNAAAAGGHSSTALIAIGVGLVLGPAAFGSAFGQGRATSAALEGISRNPAAAGKIQVPMILGLAFMEALTIFAWLVAQNLAGKI